MTRRALIPPSIVIALIASAVFSGCSSPARVAPIIATVNENGSLSPAAANALPANPLKWIVITSSIDPQASTMSTLYGNDIAVRYARSNTKHDYPAGSQIALVTWTRRDDPRYFGAKIPDHLKSIEFVTVTELPGETNFAYEKFEGTPLAKTASDESAKPSPSAQSLLQLRAAVLP
jgi:Cytochrome P460